MEQIKGFTKKTSCFAMGKVPWLKKIGSEAQKVEQLAVNQKAVGSTPTGTAKTEIQKQNDLFADKGR